MHIYDSRESGQYLMELQRLLSPPLDAHVRDVAVPIERPFTTKAGQEFTHCFRIDFLGLAATRLFDVGGRSAPNHMYTEVHQLCKRATEMNRHGVFLRMRFLLQYPYGTSAIQRMQAEWSSNRASMDEPKYKRDFDFVEQIDEKLFHMSSFVTTQATVLEQIQDLTDELRGSDGWAAESPNKIVLRFTPVHPNVCALFVNQEVFYDVYLMAKQARGMRRCPPIYTPLTQLDNAVDQAPFRALEDHFRYLWELDVTLDAEDATAYRPGVKRSLAHVKSPEEVQYDHKAQRIRAKNAELSHEVSLQWKAAARRVLESQFCGLSPAPAGERLFVSCGWSKDASRRGLPNPDARDMARFLAHDFTATTGEWAAPYVTVDVLEASPGGLLYRQLYEGLDGATLGLVMLTNDHELRDGKWRSSPNVYHELGYLMRHVGASRVMVVCEEGAYVPTNVQDLVRTRFARGKAGLIYHEIAEWMGEALFLAPTAIIRILVRHGKRMMDLVETGSLELEEVKAVKARIRESIGVYRARVPGLVDASFLGGGAGEEEF